jgi:hypothetical protein
VRGAQLPEGLGRNGIVSIYLTLGQDARARGRGRGRHWDPDCGSGTEYGSTSIAED